MIHISPEQKLFTEIFMRCRNVFGTDMVYDYLPNQDVPYPFIFVGEQNDAGVRNNKDKRFVSLMQTVHIYHNNPRQRGTIARLVKDVQTVMFGIKRVNGHKVTVLDDAKQTLPDNTTNTPLMHIAIDVTYEIQ